jgi:uncharacterized protein (TIGR01244 family)
MDLRAITDSYSVAPQLEPADMATLAASGVTTVICNRPDGENPPPLQAAAMQAAAEAAGLAFVFNPVVGGQLTMDNVDEQRDAIDGAEGPVVAYCASGNRSTVVWALGMAGSLPTDEIIARGEKCGYQLQWLRAQIDTLAKRED